jgi:1,4-dihydroxy-6-naphthoate synthase
LPPDVKEKINRLVRKSVAFAMANPASSYDYVKKHAQEMDEEVRKKHIALYVNNYSVDLGAGGRKAIEIFFEKALQTGIINSIPGNIFLNPVAELSSQV